jgi:hypothetical protein
MCSWPATKPTGWAQAIEADIFLNLSEAEGFCIAVAEAMLAVCP